MKKFLKITLITVGVLVLLFILLLASRWHSGNPTNLSEVAAAQGTESFPQTVAGLPLSDISNEKEESCEEEPIKICGKFVDHLYVSPDKTAPWAFSVRATDITSGDLAGFIADAMNDTRQVKINGQTVYLKSNGVIWQTNSSTADFVTIVLKPIDSLYGTVDPRHINTMDVRRNADFISVFLAAFPPVKQP
jgi:hypothetical protein